MNRPYLRGRPIPVNFLGFMSDTYQLQQAGWQIAEEMDYHSREVRFAIRHPDHHISGMSQRASRDGLLRWAHIDYQESLTLHITLAVNYMVVEHGMSTPRFVPVDAAPTFIEYAEPVDMYDAPYFRPLDDGKEIFLRKASVEEIMQIALDKQEPEQAGIRARQRAEHDREKFKRGGETKARLIMVA